MKKKIAPKNSTQRQYLPRNMPLIVSSIHFNIMYRNLIE